MIIYQEKLNFFKLTVSKLGALGRCALLSDCRVLTTPRLTACYMPAACHRCTAAMRRPSPHANVVPQRCVARCLATSAALRRSATIVYIRNSKKGRFYTCMFIENGLRKALCTYIFQKKSVFVCTFFADRGKNGRNAHINSTKKPFSYVRNFTYYSFWHHAHFSDFVCIGLFYCGCGAAGCPG